MLDQPHFSVNANKQIKSSLPLIFARLGLAPGLVLATYLLWPSLHYDADGLSYVIWNQSGPTASGNNHALTPMWYWAWWNFVSAFSGSQFSDRMFWLALMNSLAAAISVALVVDLIYRKTGQIKSAICCATLLGISAAFFYHATHTTEPMVGLTWFLLSWRLLLKPISPWRMALSGAAFALSVASYQSFALGGFGLLLMIIDAKSALRLWLATALISGTLLFFGAAFAAGSAGFSDAFHYVFGLAGGGVWGVWKWERIPALAIGLTNAVTPITVPEVWPGWKQGIGLLPWPDLLSVFSQAFSFVFFLTLILWKDWPLLRSDRELRAVLLMLVASLFPPFYWEPYYYKLWLMPLCTLIIFIGMIQANNPRFPSLLCLIIVIVSCANVNGVFRKYSSPDHPQVVALRHLERSVTNRDLLISDGWDHGRLYEVKNPTRLVCPLLRGGPQDVAGISRLIESAWAAGGRVYFFGLLERPEEQWKHSIERFCNLSYASHEPWRRQAKLIWQGKSFGFSGDLYQLEKPMPHGDARPTAQARFHPPSH
jgi:hypothetical protein